MSVWYIHNDHFYSACIIHRSMATEYRAHYRFFYFFYFVKYTGSVFITVSAILLIFYIWRCWATIVETERRRCKEKHRTRLKYRLQNTKKKNTAPGVNCKWKIGIRRGIRLLSSPMVHNHANGVISSHCNRSKLCEISSFSFATSKYDIIVINMHNCQQARCSPFSSLYISLSSFLSPNFYPSNSFA